MSKTKVNLIEEIDALEEQIFSLVESLSRIGIEVNKEEAEANMKGLRASLLESYGYLEVLDIINAKAVNVAQFRYWLKKHLDHRYDVYEMDRSQEGWYIHIFDNEESDYKLTEEEFNKLVEVYANEGMED